MSKRRENTRSEKSQRGDREVEGSPKFVLIADDHALLSDTVSYALIRTQRYVTDSAGTLDDALKKILDGTFFDIVLLDLHMPGMEGIESVRQVVDAAGLGKVILFSGNSDEDLIRLAIEHGARGFIPKEMPFSAVCNVIELVLSGQVFLPANLRRDSVKKISPDVVLSDDEISIMKLVAQGLTNKEIAGETFLSEVDIKMKMRTIFQRIGARNRAHAVTICRNLGIV
jgi:two-component system, NarL family, nitrate/nitrite response regulator NarL